MKRAVNYHFLIISAALLCAGTLFLATLSGIESLQAFGNTHYYIFHQLMAIGIGLALALAAFFAPLPLVKRFALPLLLLNLGVMMVVFVPFLGAQAWGARRWISIAGASLQPSEFLKISAIVYLSAWLSSKYHKKDLKKGFSGLARRGYEDVLKVFLPFVVLLAAIGATLYLQKDASTLGIVTIALLAVYFAAGTPVWNLLLLLATGAGAAFALIKFEPYRVQRFLIFLHPELDPLGIGFQLKQSILAIGSGGWFGKGIGMSTQKFGFLPQAMTDSMFAIIGEEVGLVGAAAVVLAFGYFCWQGFRIAAGAQDQFGRLAAIGLTTWITFQAFINIASAMGLFPLAGIPLPFFSYGGSHIMAELLAVGLLLNISKNG